MTAGTGGRGGNAPGAEGFLARIAARAGGPDGPGLVRPRPVTRFEPATAAFPVGEFGLAGDEIRTALPLEFEHTDEVPGEPATAAPARSALPGAASRTAVEALPPGEGAALDPRPPAAPRGPAPADPPPAADPPSAVVASVGAPDDAERRQYGVGSGPADFPEPSASHEPLDRPEPGERGTGSKWRGDPFVPPEPHWYPNPSETTESAGGAALEDPGGPGQDRAHMRHRPQSPGAPGPSVHVTIGRVEVRAVPPGASAPGRARPPEPVVSSLEQYLRRRTRGQE